MYNKKELIKNVLKLSLPAILAEISSIIMQYIDAAMVGSLGANGTASIGIVSSSQWLIGGICIGAATGFSVQVAQFVGGNRNREASDVLRQSILVCAVIGLVLTIMTISISEALPVWLGGDKSLQHDASVYFRIYGCFLMAQQFRCLAGSMLQCSGDMRTPSILNGIMCALDVVFNLFLIFPTRMISIGGLSLTLPGAGMGVTGAALGTAMAELTIAIILMWCVCVRSEKIRITRHGHWKLQKKCIKNASIIALPMVFEHTVMCGAQIMSTHIVAPLGTVSVAANSLAVTAESFCYMPGYGIGSAATTLVGQSIGASDKKTARAYARISVLLGMILMTIAGIFMYILAPFIFEILTPDLAVRELGTRVLRIEVLAEPMFAASIVAAGALRGAGDTLIPSIMNLISMWGVRIVLALILTPYMGLKGVWIAMCVELWVRGAFYLFRLLKERWLKKSMVL